MDTKDKEEIGQVVAETLREVLMPSLEDMHQDIKDVKNRLTKVESGLTKVESEIRELKYEVKGLRDAENEQDGQLRNHELRITTLESV